MSKAALTSSLGGLLLVSAAYGGTAFSSAEAREKLRPPGASASEKQVLDYIGRLQEAPDPGHVREVAGIVRWRSEPAVLISGIRTLPSLVSAGGGPAEAVDALERIVNTNSNARLRRAAIVALSSIRSPQAFEVLLDAAEREYDPVPLKRLYWGMSRLSKQNLPPVFDLWFRWWEEQQLLARTIEEDMYSGSRTRLLAAVAAIAQLSLPAKGLLDDAAGLFDEQDPVLRGAACLLFATPHLQTPQVLERLNRLGEEEPDRVVRKAALAALGRDAPEESVPASEEREQEAEASPEQG